MPVSLIGAFAFVHLLGFSINTLTLFAIVLATGIVVDDAIVVIENVERHIQEYRKSPRQAASDAMREVFGAVIATALVLIAVFVPVAFFPGTTGRLYQQFALTIAFSVAISAFNALDADAGAVGAAPASTMRRARVRSSGRVERWLHATARTSTCACVRGLMRVRWAMAVVFVGLLGATYYVYNRVPTRVHSRRGRRLLHHDRPGAARRVARIHDQRGQGGREDPAGGARSRVGVLDPRLQLCRQRRRTRGSSSRCSSRSTSASSAKSAFKRSCRACAVRCRHPGRAGLPGRAARHQHRQRRRLHDGGARPGRRRRERRGARRGGLRPGRRIASSSTRVAGVFSSFTANDPQLAVDIDREKARSLGLPISEITNAMQIYLGSAYVNDFDLQQPRLPGVRAGGQGVPIRPWRPRPVLRANHERATWCRWPASCAYARRRRRR